MQFYIWPCLIFTLFCVSLSSGNPIRVKRTARLNMGNRHGLTFDDRNPKFISQMEDMMPNFGHNKRSVRNHIRPKRMQQDYDSYEEVYESGEPAPFYPYKNVGSLYVDGENLKINEPLYNYGVDTYGYPPYGYPEIYAPSEEVDA